MVEPTSHKENLRALRQAIETLLNRSDGPLAAVAKEAKARLELLAVRLASRDEQDRLAALYHVSRALGSSLQLDQALNQVMDAVIQLTGAERGFLMLLDRETGELDLQAARNFERKNLDREDMQVSRTVIKEVVRTGEGLVTTNAQTDARFAQQPSVMRYALRSILCVPLRARGEVSGVIYVDNTVKAALFSEREREMLEAFAAQAAVALENARLYTRTDTALAERVAELETLQRLDRELNAGLDFERVLDLTLDWAVRGTQAESGWIAMRSGDSQTMSIVAGAGKGAALDPTWLPSAAAPPGAARRMPFLGRNGSADGPPSRTHETTSARLTLPVRREEETIAWIGVQRDGKPFAPDAEAFLQRLAEHAAVAIENTRLYQAVQQANLAKSQFISVVSHEIKIPMTSIRGYADLIRIGTAGPVSDQQSQFLEAIRNNVDRMATLVSDLSDISRIETGRLRMDLSAVALDRYLRETASGLMPQIEAKRQSLLFELPEALPAVWVDPARLVQVLTNLLSNANKYTPEGGEITACASPQPEFVKVSIRDNGLGMSPEDQAGLFRQFFRSENPAVREQAGWGLGLNVTRLLIQRMGGEIGVQSELGKGSTFWFTLPIAR